MEAIPVYALTNVRDREAPVNRFKLAVKRSLDRKTVFGTDNQAAKFIGLLTACQMVSASLEQKKIFGIVQSYLSQELKSQHSAIYSLQDKDPIRIEAVVNDQHREWHFGFKRLGAVGSDVEDPDLHRHFPLR